MKAKNEGFDISSSRIDLLNLCFDNPSDPKCFSTPRVITTAPLSLSPQETKYLYDKCISQPGATMKGCLIVSRAGENTDMCRQICKQDLKTSMLSDTDKLKLEMTGLPDTSGDKYCNSVCYDMIFTLRNSASSGIA
jgi:hypothetical protein